MDKALRNTIIGGIIILTLSVAYYVVVFLPQKERNNDIAENNFSIGDPNKSLEYGETGAPKNCRAIIAENIKVWKQKTFSAEDALTSIDRNCGESGYSWGK